MDAFIAPIIPQSRRPTAARVHARPCMRAARQPSMRDRPIPNPLRAIARRISVFSDTLRELELLTRPGSIRGADGRMQDRFDGLPAHVKTPSQMLGRLSPGCEGTKGVFPRCNFGCQPCYHSADANRVRVDGMHTVTEVARQMKFLQQHRGPTAHCQLIGGEVSLLSPEDHALALETMRFYGRIPMSFTHGDFSYEYLKALAVRPDGTKRFDRLDFAVHFDMEMRGRTGIERPTSELQLSPYRRRFIQMFERLKREHGVEYYIAHNMTVQPSNLEHIADAVHEAKVMGFRLMSFQPAAQQGNKRRWVTNLRTLADDDGEMVWNEIEKGMGIRLPYTLFQMGDVRCNRMCVCGFVGRRGDTSVTPFPFFDDQCKADVYIRDLIMEHMGNIVLKPRLLIFKATRSLLTRPWLLIPLFFFFQRIVARAGGILRVLRYGFHPVTIVMHRFMDAKDVEIAWGLMDNGVSSDDETVDAAGPRIRETMERLASCSYAMAHPDAGRVVPACVQHSVYDPAENAQLAKELPLREPSPSDSVSEVQLASELS